MKLSKGDTVRFNCPYAEKVGKIVSVDGDSVQIQTPISIWTVKITAVLENYGKKVKESEVVIKPVVYELAPEPTTKKKKKK